MTFFIHEFAYNGQYSNPDSQLFQEFQQLFCDDVSIT